MGFEMMEMTKHFFSMTPELWKEVMATHTKVSLGMRARHTALSGNPALQRRALQLSIGWAPMMLDNLMRYERERHLELMGPRGANIIHMYDIYDRDADHVDLRALFSLDMQSTFCGFSILPLLWIWGDVSQAIKLLDFHLGEMAMYAAYARAGNEAEKMSLLQVCLAIPQASLMCGQPARAYKFMLENFKTFDYMERELKILAAFNPAIVTETREHGLIHLSSLMIQVQMSWILTAPKEELLAKHPKEYYFKDIESAEVCSRKYLTDDTSHPHCSLVEICCHCWIALGFEKMDMPEKALEFAEVGLWTDWERGGCDNKFNHSICLGVIGRIRKLQGKMPEAAANFEQAADTAAMNMFGFLEVVALRDWKTVVAVGTPEAAKVNARFDKVMENLGVECKPALEALVSEVFLF